MPRDSETMAEGLTLEGVRNRTWINTAGPRPGNSGNPVQRSGIELNSLFLLSTTSY